MSLKYRHYSPLVNEEMGSILIQSMSINMAAVTELYLTEIYLYGKAKHILFSYHLFVFRAICTLLEAQMQKISWPSNQSLFQLVSIYLQVVQLFKIQDFYVDHYWMWAPEILGDLTTVCVLCQYSSSSSSSQQSKSGSASSV